MTIVSAIISLRPGAQWTLKTGATSVEDLTWLDTEQTKPTQAEVDAAIAAIAAGPSFAERRAALLATFRADRERMITRLEILSNRAFRSGDAPKATVCDTLSDALLDITTHPAVLAATDMGALELATENLYDAAVNAALTNPAAPTLLADFGRMDE